MKPTRDRLIALAGTLVIAFIYFWSYGRAVSKIPDGMGDFIHFYEAARAMLLGKDIFASGTGGYIYPPLIAYVYMPLARLDFAAAARTDLIINIAISAATLFIGARESARRCGLKTRPVVIALIASAAAIMMADKMRTELRMGQTNALMLLCFALGLVWMDRRPTLAGLVLGLAFNIKYLPIVLLPYLLVRRRWHTAGAFVAGILLFAFLPALHTGWSQNLHDLRVAFAGMLNLVGLGSPGAAAQIQTITAPLSVSVTSALARAMGGDGAAKAASIAGLGVGAVFLVIWGAAYWSRKVPIVDWSQRGPSDPGRTLLQLFEWTSLIVFTLAFSPQTNMRHMYMTLLPIIAGVALFAALPKQRAWVGASVLIGVLGLNLPPGGAGSDVAVRFWHDHGGPAWCLLIMQTGLVWAATSAHRQFAVTSVKQGGAGA